MPPATMDRSERIRIFLARLTSAEPAADFDEAVAQIAAILNAVEDEFSGVPFDPENWMADGRLYPPQPDNEHDVPGRAGWSRFRTRGHNIFISSDGSIEIVHLAGELLLKKNGRDASQGGRQ